MNSFTSLKIFATALVVTVISGPIIQWLLPNWSSLVERVGTGGAWFMTIMYHLVYGIIIGAGAAFADMLLRRSGRVVSIQSAVVATLLTVGLFDVGFVLLAPKVHQFAYLALFLLITSFIMHNLATFIGIGRGLPKTSP